MKTKLRIAVQKSGRLSEGTLDLLKKAGVKVETGKRQLKAQAVNFPAEILFLRDDDIPQYVADEVADIGVVGENVWAEKAKGVQITKRLGFSKCRMSLAIPKSETYNGLTYFNGKKIATSYPNILQSYLDEHSITADIHMISGSVEIAPNIGLASGILDIVSSGSTLFANGLKEVETILKSEAVLISKADLNEEKKRLLDTLLFRIDSVLKAKSFKYILLNAPSSNIDKIVSILPGMRSPTVLPLHESDWCSVHSVISEQDFWEIIDELKANGAEGILLTAIDKMIL